MKAFLLALTLVVISAVSWAIGTASAQPHHGWHQWNAVVRCDEPMEEDGFAHVRLAVFDRDKPYVVYRCVKNF